MTKPKMDLLDLDVCRYGPHCRSRDGDQPGDADGRGLCWPDERAAAFAISQLFGDWRQLHQAVTVLGAGGISGIPANRAEAPIPLNLTADVLMRHIAWDVTTWATVVRDVARLAEVPERGVRPHVAVARGVETLTAHFSVLLALRPTDYLPYGGEETMSGRQLPDEMDGPAAVIALTDLHHWTRSMIGLTRRREPRALPCPAPVDPCNPTNRDGCGQPTLVFYIEHMNDRIDCTNCGWSCSLDEYSAYVKTLVPPALAVGAA